MRNTIYPIPLDTFGQKRYNELTVGWEMEASYPQELLEDTEGKCDDCSCTSHFCMSEEPDEVFKRRIRDLLPSRHPVLDCYEDGDEAYKCIAMEMVTGYGRFNTFIKKLPGYASVIRALEGRTSQETSCHINLAFHGMPSHATSSFWTTQKQMMLKFAMPIYAWHAYLSRPYTEFPCGSPWLDTFRYSTTHPDHLEVDDIMEFIMGDGNDDLSWKTRSDLSYGFEERSALAFPFAYNEYRKCRFEFRIGGGPGYQTEAGIKRIENVTRAAAALLLATVYKPKMVEALVRANAEHYIRLVKRENKGERISHKLAASNNLMGHIGHTNFERYSSSITAIGPVKAYSMNSRLTPVQGDSTFAQA